MDFESEAQAAGAIDIGAYYATDGEGGKPTSLLAANAINQAIFDSAIALTSASQPTNVIYESGTNTPAKRYMPLWQALGLSSDPGGYIDIVCTLSTAIC